ncbi:30S ribosome-binding factor RbfA [Pseudotabrizicola formosa]|uniref:30S ribosome-binding factor RbfA n=1 Tax=Pseudotabrizicola formosa TaxID=2030009 RepID=UPI000CD158DB|nr:30S ribosome-binding factor RbfA [Pseudotabrizicola formosa]
MSNKRNSQGDGPNQRQLRVGELIRRTLADVLNRAEIHDPDLNRMSITVGEVSVSNDLKVATVYVMPLMGSVPVEDAIAALARNKGELRHRVASQLTLKFAPDLRFRPDETFDRLDETRRLFSDPKVVKDLSAPDEDDAAPEGGTPPDRDA